MNGVSFIMCYRHILISSLISTLSANGLRCSMQYSRTTTITRISHASWRLLEFSKDCREKSFASTTSSPRTAGTWGPATSEALSIARRDLLFATSGLMSDYLPDTCISISARWKDIYVTYAVYHRQLSPDIVPSLSFPFV